MQLGDCHGDVDQVMIILDDYDLILGREWLCKLRWQC